MSGTEDFDFTGPTGQQAPPPAEKVAEARKEASAGGPQLASSGFYVTLARRATGGPVPPHDGRRHTVLVIEDDAEMLNLVVEVLLAAGFHVRTAKDRAQINAEFNKPPLPDLLLLDVGLPDADGFQILERIRGNRSIARLPVILMTGKSEPADIARGLALSVDGYVTKPFKLSALISAVGTVLGLD